MINRQNREGYSNRLEQTGKKEVTACVILSLVGLCRKNLFKSISWDYLLKEYDT
jgi:hypothetical protein